MHMKTPNAQRSANEGDDPPSPHISHDMERSSDNLPPGGFESELPLCRAIVGSQVRLGRLPGEAKGSRKDVACESDVTVVSDGASNCHEVAVSSDRRQAEMETGCDFRDADIVMVSGSRGVTMSHSLWSQV